MRQAGSRAVVLRPADLWQEVCERPVTRPLEDVLLVEGCRESSDVRSVAVLEPRRTDLERLADEAVSELIASGAFAHYSGGLPPRAREVLSQSSLRPDDESVLEDLFAERMIELTRNDYVEEVADDDIDDKILARSHHRPVMVDVYSDYCRPCNHILPIVYQLAAQYRDELTVVKINISKHARFRETYLGPVQMTPAFLFFRSGRPVRASGRLARLLGQTAVITSTRKGLETRIRGVLNMHRKSSS